MISVASILEKELNSIKDDVAQSIKDNNRSASGKTIKSLKVEVTTNNGITTGTLSGRGDITSLETGVNSNQFKNSDTTIQDIAEWMDSRGINRGALAPIWRTLNSQGWNTTRRNRTGNNGGTAGIISDPINNGLASIEDQIADIALVNTNKEIKL